MRDYFDGYDEQPIDPGFKNEPLAADDYPMTCEKIVRASFSTGGSLGVTMLMRVNEGPYEKRTALVQQWITAAITRPCRDANDDFVRDADNNIERENVPDDVYDAKTAKAVMRTRGIVHAFTSDAQPRDTMLDAPSGFPTDEDAAYYLERTGLNDCVGQDAIVTITTDRDGRNGATKFVNVKDPKNGIGAWRNKTLPKQQARRDRENPQVAATPAL